jgi:uncharacterized protein
MRMMEREKDWEEEKKSRFTNRLIQEKSPYLLQHAHNPVNWYPWGEEAFKTAKEQDKPIFLSIGYATCHWCHVMDEECFQDEDVAKVLNDAFIPVKIDREELPEIDAIYMEFAQTMILGSAGWPLNLVLTPELKPIFAATYLPRHTTRGSVGIIELTKKMKDLWLVTEDRERLVNQSDRIVNIIRAHIHTQGTDLPGEAQIQKTAEILLKIADPIYGGMKGAPKFPLGYQALFLLHYFLRAQDTRALFLVEKTFEMMHRGGIYDHLGGGFSRYSVDEKWHIPHFEKMLYDNALLTLGYLELWRVTGREVYSQVTCEIIDYILREMTSSEGGFFSGQDADSQGVEGLYYTWRPEEVLMALGKEEGLLFCDYYGIDEEGNFDGRTVPFIQHSMAEFAEMRGLPVKECQERLEAARKFLLKVRSGRPSPLKDDKIIVAWNAMMIDALLKAGFYLQKPEYMDAAKRAMLLIKNKLYVNGLLYRRYREGDVRFRACLDDYAYLIQAAITFFELGQGVEWLSFALELNEYVELEFKAEQGAYYQTDRYDPHLLLRKCHYSDGAEPSANAIQTENLLRLYQLTLNKRYLECAEDVMKAAKRYIDVYPLGYCYHLKVMQRYYDRKKTQLVVVFDKNGSSKEEIIEALSHKVLPHYTLIFAQKDDGTEKVLPFLEKIIESESETALYICHEGACQTPVRGKQAILEAIRLT